MKSKNFIELNGKHYDATTGAVLSTALPPKTLTGHNMDGFFRTPQPKASPSVAYAPKIAITVSAASAPTQPAHPKRSLNHAVAHHPEAPKTLMRSAVKRPTASFKQQATIQGSLQRKVPSLVVAKQPISSVNPERLRRAGSVKRSPDIAHHNLAVPPVAVQFAPLAVQPTPTTHAAIKTVASTPPAHHNPLDMFEQAVANAGQYVDTRVHKAQFKKHARQHFSSMAAGTLALLVIAGFAAYQNTPGLQFKVASVQAGVATRMPNFQAAGFAYNGVRAANGTLTVGFSGQGAHYQLSQQPTNWSSRDMIQNVASTDASGNPNYATLKVGSTMVYKLSNNTATWVTGGKWYQVSGTGALNDHQLQLLVANS